jgi:hypothetical protein
MIELRQRMADIKISIETIWKPFMEFRNCSLLASDLVTISSTITAVSFVGCRSEEWAKIGMRLATLKQLKTL